MKIWDDKEVVDLFATVEVCRQEGNPIKRAFEKHCVKYSRKANSVRNYYYQEIERLKVDEPRKEKLKINLDSHQKKHFVCFDNNEKDLILKNINELTSKGMSVRSACLKLSEGDLAKMTRLQNKYQSIKRNNNIIPFKQQHKILTENEINSLFLGLVRLIKRSVEDECLSKIKEQKKADDFLLRKAFHDLSNAENALKSIKIKLCETERKNEELSNLLEAKNKHQKLKNKLKEYSLENYNQN